MRLPVLAVVLSVAAAPAWAKPKKAVPAEAARADGKPAASCPEGAPDQPTVDRFAGGDAEAGQAVKAYAKKCPSFACRVGKALYLQGYTYKDSDAEKAIALLRAALELGPRDEECGAKAKPLLAKLSKGRR